MRDERGWTPLLLSAAMGHTASTEMLVSRGGNLNARDRYGYTPLMRAAESGYGDICRLLVARGADVNLLNQEGHTALDLARDANPRAAEGSGLWARLGPLGVLRLEHPRGQYAAITRDLLAHGARSGRTLVSTKANLKKAP